MKMLSSTEWVKEATTVASVNSELANILDKVAREQGSSKILKAEFSYGEMVLSDGKIDFPDLPPDFDLAFGVVIAGGFEIYICGHKIVSLAVLKAGQTFILLDDPNLSLMPFHMMNMSAGARSLFLLPKITDTLNYRKLAKAYGLKRKEPPQALRDHWQIFVEVAKNAGSSWSATVFFFDKGWVNCETFPSHQLYQYLGDNNLPKRQFFRKKLVFEMAFAETLAQLRFKPDPFLIENIKQLFALATNFVPGFVFAEDESLAPIKLLQDAFVRHYGLLYTPSILQPGYAEKGRQCYHSLQHPAFLGPAYRKKETNLEQMRELYRVLQKTVEHIQHIDPISSELIDFINAELEFFHVNAEPKHREVEPSIKIESFDPVVQSQVASFSTPFSDASSFLRKGCISVSKPRNAS